MSPHISLFMHEPTQESMHEHEHEYDASQDDETAAGAILQLFLGPACTMETQLAWSTCRMETGGPTGCSAWPTALMRPTVSRATHSTACATGAVPALAQQCMLHYTSQLITSCCRVTAITR
jgi:hypothetical protein